MKKDFDIAIVGSGPAAMGFLYKYMAHPRHGTAVVFERGRWRSAYDIANLRTAKDRGEEVDIVSGTGGAGAPSDGKYNKDYSGRVGGKLISLGLIDPATYARLLDEGAEMLIRYGGRADRLFGAKDPEEARSLIDRYQQHNLSLHTFEILHLGTDTGPYIVDNFYREMIRQGLELYNECGVLDVTREGDCWRLMTEKGEYVAKKVVLAPGRSGAPWFQELATRLKLSLVSNGVDIGVRAETLYSVTEEVTRAVYEMKLYGHFCGLDIRSFCVAPRGHTVAECYKHAGNILLANGHTNRDHLSPNTNFALLATVHPPPGGNALGYLQSIARTSAEYTGGRLILQTLKDLLEDRSSTWDSVRINGYMPTLTDETVVLPGNLGHVLPRQVLNAIIEFVRAMDQVSPGLSEHMWFTGPEGKLYSMRPECSADGQVAPGMYAIGDGPGKTRGLNGAIIDGMNTGEHVIAEL